MWPHYANVFGRNTKPESCGQSIWEESSKEEAAGKQRAQVSLMKYMCVSVRVYRVG